MKTKAVLMRRLSGILLAVLLLFFTAAACSPSDAPRLGVWWWKDILGDEYLEFAKEQGVTEIYYHSNRFDEETDAFIEKAEKRGMRVYWLGDKQQWIENPTPCLELLEKYFAYEASYEHKFSGIHFDVEPQKYSDFHEREQELLTKFIAFAYSLREKYPNAWIEYDLPCWLDKDKYVIAFNGEEKYAFAHIMDCASRVTLMSYRDTAEKIYEFAESEIAYAKSIGMPLNLGVAVRSTEGDNVSFMEEGKAVMNGEIKKLRELLPPDYGVAVHQVQQWYELKD